METLLLVLLVIIVIALIVWNLPRLRGQAAARRVRPRTGAVDHNPDPMTSAQPAPGDDVAHMRAQAHREASVRDDRP